MKASSELRGQRPVGADVGGVASQRDSASPYYLSHHPILDSALLVIRVQFASGATKIRQAVREADEEEQERR